MPRSDQLKLPGIFISYRRSDNPDATGRIYDRLVSEFGKARVFKDVDSIPLGQDFRGHLNEVVGDCAVVLAIIGPRWTDARNSAGQRRLEDADDFVRIELEAALARGIPVVPVLVAHASMPGTADLPASLASMVFRQSIEVRPDPDFHNDATRLVSALRAMLDPNAPRVEPHAGKPGGSWLPWLAGLAAVLTLATIALAIPALKYLRATPPPESRIAIALPVQEAIDAYALSPDGRQIVYKASGDSQFRLWLRPLSATTAQPLPGTEFGTAPFWSPDSRAIGFFAGSSLKRLDLGGGQPQTLAAPKAGSIGVNGIWLAGGDILFNTGPGQPIFRIAATGGSVTEVIKSGTRNMFHIPVGGLPDGQHFLFVDANGTSDGIYLGKTGGSAPARLTTDAGPAAYLPSGWLLWVRFSGAQANSGPLLARRLDVRNARLTGETVSLAGEVGAFSAAAGLVAYRTARSASQRQLAWVDRSGTELGTVGDMDGTLESPRIAPDGHRIVVSRLAQANRDLWVLDGARATRMTFNAAEDNYPVWSRDGLRVAFTSIRSGKGDLYEKLATGAGGEEDLLYAARVSAIPSGWSADGRYLLYSDILADDANIAVHPAFGDRKPFAFLQTAFGEAWGQFSPDGRWVAYESSETGRFEIFVRPFRTPGTAAQWMVSTAGGVTPLWSPNGRELYYLNPAGEMMAAPITVAGSGIVPGTPVRLFDANIWGGGTDNRTGRQYDVAPDGRFLINRVRDADTAPTITLLQNWNPDARK